MFPTLVLAAALSLSPGQNSALAISNDRLTFCGELGPVRPNNKFLPGDTVYLAFDMENLTMDGAGNVQYSMGMEVTDAAGKAIFTAPPADIEEKYPSGGSKIAARAFFTVDA